MNYLNVYAEIKGEVEFNRYHCLLIRDHHIFYVKSKLYFFSFIDIDMEQSRRARFLVFLITFIRYEQEPSFRFSKNNFSQKCGRMCKKLKDSFWGSQNLELN